MTRGAALVPSLFRALVRLEGSSLVLRAGERPFVVTKHQHVALSSRVLPQTVFDEIVQDLLSPEATASLQASGWVQCPLPRTPATGARDFTVIAGSDQCTLLTGRTAAAARTPAAPASRLAAPPAARAARDVPPPAPRFPPHVLLIDDSPDQLDLYEFALSDRYRVLSAVDGETGIALAAAERPDVVIVDLAMPRVDGWEVCRRLKRDPATASIPILILTAQDDADLERNAVLIGAAGLLRKPCNVDRLRDRIGAALRQALEARRPYPRTRFRVQRGDVRGSPWPPPDQSIGSCRHRPRSHISSANHHGSTSAGGRGEGRRRSTVPSHQGRFLRASASIRSMKSPSAE